MIASDHPSYSPKSYIIQGRPGCQRGGLGCRASPSRRRPGPRREEQLFLSRLLARRRRAALADGAPVPEGGPPDDRTAGGGSPAPPRRPHLRLQLRRDALACAFRRTTADRDAERGPEGLCCLAEARRAGHITGTQAFDQDVIQLSRHRHCEKRRDEAIQPASPPYDRWIAHMGIGWSRVCAGSPGMRREGVRMGPCLLGGARREGNTKSRMRLWRTACGGGLQGRP